MATFPLNDNPTIENYTEAIQSAVIRSTTEGIIKQAVRYAVNYTNFSVVYLISSDELTTWRAWFEDDISRGADSFDWVHPTTGDTVDARIINGVWSLAVYSADVYELTMELEVLS